MTFIIFILILSFLVFVHELGHYLVAKKNGIRVEEFGLGLPPRIYGKQVGETIYSLNLLPFGGFVRLTGEDLLEQKDGVTNDPRSFATKSAGQRAAVLVAGVAMNTLITVVLYYFLFFANGFKTLSLPLIFEHKFAFGTMTTVDTVITGFSENSVFSENDISSGEAIIKIDDTTIHSVTDVKAALMDKAGKEVNVTLADLRKGEEGEGKARILNVVPYADDTGNGVLGVYLGRSATLIYDKPIEKIFAGFLHAYNMLEYSMNVFGQLIGLSVESGSISPVSEGVSGPLGIYTIVGSILDIGGKQIFLAMLDFVALMSLSLAFLNVMPFPALDGGRLAFVVAEKVIGRKISPIFEAKVHRWGMLALLALIVLVSAKDIVRFF